MRTNAWKFLLVACAAIAWAGCAGTDATGSATVAPGIARVPVSPAEVRIYALPPLRSVLVGRVKAESEDQGEAVAELKRQAAKIGANGIVGMLGTASASADIRPAIYQEDRGAPRTSDLIQPTPQAPPPWQAEVTPHFIVTGTAVYLPAEGKSQTEPK